jgi:uridine phosphorylase
MVIGLFSSIPILVVETQMGAPATQIITNEILSDALTSLDYKVAGNSVSLPHKVVIRIGTAGGINCEGISQIAIGDVVNATHSIGVTGAVMQSLSRLDFWSPEASETFYAKWNSLGPAFTTTNAHYPRVECSENVINALKGAGEKLEKNAYHQGGNITKDSLYAELNSDLFLELCRTENCRTTEMELSAIAVAARQHNADFGMISAIIGLLPGASFVESEKAMAIAERRAIEVGLNAVESLT